MTPEEYQMQFRFAEMNRRRVRRHRAKRKLALLEASELKDISIEEKIRDLKEKINSYYLNYKT